MGSSILMSTRSLAFMLGTQSTFHGPHPSTDRFYNCIVVIYQCVSAPCPLHFDLDIPESPFNSVGKRISPGEWLVRARPPKLGVPQLLPPADPGIESFSDNPIPDSRDKRTYDDLERVFYVKSSTIRQHGC